MIVVSVQLHSAITGEVTELARMRICNDGTGDVAHGNYTGSTFRGRSRDALDRRVVSKSAGVKNFPRQSQHVWNLVARMLGAMRYR